VLIPPGGVLAPTRTLTLARSLPPHPRNPPEQGIAREEACPAAWKAVKHIAVMAKGEAGPCRVYVRPGRADNAVELSEGVVGHYNYHGRLCAIEFKNGILPIIRNGGKRKKG